MRAMAVVANDVELVEVPQPVPNSGEVRIKVIASSVNPAEVKVVSGDFVGRFLHARTNPLVVGWDFAGTVDALGDGVTDLEVGSAVWGHLAYTGSQKQGSYCEYVTVPREALAIKPEKVTYHTAAAAATVAMTSLQSLRDLGGLNEGGRALIIGAGGGIGAVAVGIGKRLGGHVTGVCSTKDVERVKALGADEVIDRNVSDPLTGKSVYDVVFDTPNVHSFGTCSNALRPGGAYVTTLPDASLVSGMVRALFTSKRCCFVQVASKRSDLDLVGEWLSDGLEVPIDSLHRIADLSTALKRQNERGRAGRVVVDVADGWDRSSK
jgi:NADPH:quinone reductase-like Zn-dependent oxidoreductase